MIKKVPFSEQVVPVDAVQAAEWMLQGSDFPPSEQLARAIETSAGGRPSVSIIDVAHAAAGD
jgi:hypothetical protein